MTTKLRNRLLRKLDSRKTPTMRLLEEVYGVDIRELIKPRNGKASKDIASDLDIPESTLSVWRKRMGFRNVRRIKPGPKGNRNA